MFVIDESVCRWGRSFKQHITLIGAHTFDAQNDVVARWASDIGQSSLNADERRERRRSEIDLPMPEVQTHVSIERRK